MVRYNTVAKSAQEAIMHSIEEVLFKAMLPIFERAVARVRPAAGVPPAPLAAPAAASVDLPRAA